MDGEPRDREGRQPGTQRGSCVKNSHGEGALGGGEPFADGEAVQHLCERPAGDEDGEAAARAEPVDDIAGAGVHDRVGEKEEREDEGIVLLVETKLVANVDRDDADGLAIEVVDERGEAEQKGDDPAELGNLHGCSGAVTNPRPPIARPSGRPSEYGGETRSSISTGPAGPGGTFHVTVCQPGSVKSCSPMRYPSMAISR